jgi:hypothetical protein
MNQQSLNKVTRPCSPPQPDWQPSGITQNISRSIRSSSHEHLPPQNSKIDVEIYRHNTPESEDKEPIREGKVKWFNDLTCSLEPRGYVRSLDYDPYSQSLNAKD